MEVSEPRAPEGRFRPFGVLRTLGLLVALYSACLAVATYPTIWTLRTNLPTIVDPLVHIWTMRWNQACLLQGKLPTICPELQYPVGAPLGYLPPMQLQTLMFMVLSPILHNDILVFNILWIFGFLLTGVGTYCLAWHVVQDRRAAFLAGLLAMLSGPMMFWSHSQLEQITFGWFPLFLVAWLRFIDRPSLRGLMVSVVVYLLLSMSAPYFVVFGVIPAVFSAVWQSSTGGWRGIWAWWWSRIGWFSAFVGLTGPVLALGFSSQIWAMTHGFPMTRHSKEYELYAASFWSYLIPMPQQLFAKVLPNFYAEATGRSGVSSYLGIVTCFLLYLALSRRVRFARSWFWWSMLGAMLVLSLGAYWTIGSHQVPLPGLWLRKYVFAFRPIRVPARFNLFVAVCAAVVAAAGLKHLLASLPNRGWRAVAFGGIVVLALADLSSVPFGSSPPPPMPAAYDYVLKRDPRAAILESPQCNYGFHLPAACTYWQSTHGGRTSAGYTASLNLRQEHLLVENSPFTAALLAKPEYLAEPRIAMLDIVRDVDFSDYAWLYLNYHDFRFVVLHQRSGSFPEAPVRLDRIKERMAPARVFEDEATAVYDASLFKPPSRPTALCTEGWRYRADWKGRHVRLTGSSARLAIYNPDPGRELSLILEAVSYRKPRHVRLVANGVEVASWEVGPGEFKTFESPSFALSAGIQEVKIECDGAESPSKPRYAPANEDMTPISLLVGAVEIRTASPVGGAGLARGTGDDPSRR